MRKSIIPVVLTIILIFSLSCGSKGELKKNAIIKGQTVFSENITVYNVNPDLTKGEGFKSTFNIFIGLSDIGFQFEPTEWNRKMTSAYGTIKDKRYIQDKILYDLNGHFMRSKSPNASVSKEYDCYLTAEVDTVKKICNVTILLDIDSLIFELKYK
jgi:hypothetical protein